MRLSTQKNNGFHLRVAASRKMGKTSIKMLAVGRSKSEHRCGEKLKRITTVPKISE